MFWLLILIVFLFYLYIKKRHRYWKEKGVPQTKPVFLIGDIWNNLIRKQSPCDFTKEIYNEANGYRYYGFYQVLLPSLLIKDLNLIKQITVKDFDHFQDHRILPVDDPLWANNLLSLKGQRWKEMRTTLSPTFTSSKMRIIFELINDCGKTLSKYFLSQDEEDLKSLELRDIFTRFANDVIASAAFGIKYDSLKNRENEFYTMGRRLVTDFTTNKRRNVMTLFPKLAKFLKLKVFEKEVTDFFSGIIKKTIDIREKNDIVRPDMIHILMQARKNGLHQEEQNERLDTGFATVQESDIGKPSKQTKIKLTDDDIIAQALIFFFAGFDSVMSTMSFMAHELATHPEIQERLLEEIVQTYERCNGNVTYEALLRMKYLDMVVSETLRKWPNFVFTDRVVTKPYVIQPVNLNEKPVHLDVDDHIGIPIYGLHHDPAYFPNPEKFDPERFSDENKASINPYTYMPFGVGPRNCIGSRFALIEIKSVFFYLLSKFEIVVTEKTEIPLSVNKKSFNLSAANGYWLGLKRRSKDNKIN